jgi:tRNA dimethylallyltransferase
MIAQGLITEVENMVNMGYDFNLPAMSGIGYKQIGMYLKGELSLADAVQQIKTETHRFVRHQYAWFQLKDKRIHWFDIQSQPDSEIETAIAEFIRSE